MQVDRKVLEQALELLQSAHVATSLVWPRHDCVEALKAALEQPVQEPVAIVSSVTEPGQYGVKVRWLGGFPQIAMKLYTHPPRNQEPLCK